MRRQRRQFRRRQTHTGLESTLDLLVGRQRLELAVKATCLGQIRQLTAVNTEHLRSGHAGDSEQRVLSNVVRQHQRRHVVGHRRQQRIPFLRGQ